jgi:uncharacterized protein (DUF1015 family)
MILPFKGLRPSNQRNLESIRQINEILQNGVESSLSDMDHVNNFLRYQKQEFFEEQQYCYYVYQIESCYGWQTGLITLIDMNNPSKFFYPHENVKMEKGHFYTAFLKEKRVQANPVLLLHKFQTPIKALLNELTQSSPTFVLKQNNNCIHRLWTISDIHLIRAIHYQYDQISHFYIGDGHHRYYAANSNSSSKSFLLSWLIADNEANLIPCHWVVPHLIRKDSQNENDIFEHIETLFVIEQVLFPFQPEQYHELGMYFNNLWYKLKIKETISEKYSALILKALLEETLKLKVLSIQSEVTELASLAKRHSYELAFSLPVITVEDLINFVHDRGRFPASTTFFAPKPAIGIVSCNLDSLDYENTFSFIMNNRSETIPFF